MHQSIKHHSYRMVTHIWDFTSRSSVFPVTMIFMLVSISWTQNSCVLVEKIVLSTFWQIVFYAIQHRYYFLEIVAVSESRILCASMFCHVLISWSCQMGCQNCGSMFICHIAVSVLQMEHDLLLSGGLLSHNYFVSVLYFFKSNWSPKTKWLYLLLFSHPFTVFVRTIKQKSEYGRLTA